MRFFTLATALSILYCGTAQGSENIWQLGIGDKSADEFLAYSSSEFKTNPEILKNPGYRAAEQSFTYHVPDRGAIANPQMPAGISGGNSGNLSLVRQQTIVWREKTGGLRELELQIIPAGHKKFQGHRLNPNPNMDIDGMDILRHSLRLQLPDGSVRHEFLPYDLEQYIGKHGPVVVKLTFQVKPGENRITMRETSGRTYGRCYHFDYLALKRAGQPLPKAAVIEISPGRGFLHRSIYDAAKPASVNIDLYNLRPDCAYRARIDFVNYFDRTVKTTTLPVKAGADGHVAIPAPCPEHETGHFRVRVALLENGKPVNAQMGRETAETRIAAVRMIAPFSEQEIDRSFIGLCGLSQCNLFDPYVFSEQERMDDYRAFRRLLQIHHERIHSLDWQFLEKEEGKFRWSYWDAMLDAELKDRIRVQLCILGTPEWLTRKFHPDKQYAHLFDRYNAVPPDMKKWGEVCGLIAARYKDKVREIEIWNEPSEQSIFWYQGTAKDYFELVKTASEAIRKAAPNLKIVAETVWSRQPEFTLKLYELGIGKYIDYPADHYMRDDRIGMINRLLDKVGRNRGLQCNEAKCDITGSMGQIDEASRREAAREIVRNYIYANANGVFRVYNFLLTSGTWRMWGAIGPDNTPKYTFSALKTLNNRFAGAEYCRSFSPAAGVEAYVYKYFSPQRIKENGGDNIILLVNRNDRPGEVRLFVNRPEITVVDLMDNARKVNTADGLLSLSLTADPVMLIGSDLTALELARCLRAEVKSTDTQPGKPIVMEFRLDRNDQIKQAELQLVTDELTKTTPPRFELKPGQRKTLEISLDRMPADGIYPVRLTGTLITDRMTIAVDQSFALTVASIAAGKNMLPENGLSGKRLDWVKWGDAKLEYTPSGAKVTVNGTGAIRTVKPVKVIPDCRYYFSVKARGEGLFRVMCVVNDAKGKTIEELKNFVNGQLGGEPKTFAVEWTAPKKAAEVTLHLYLYKTAGWFEASQAEMIRLQPDMPVNRQLFQVTAAHRNITVDGNADDWKDLPFTPLKDVVMNDYRGTEDIAAAFAAAWNDNTLYLAAKVTDNRHRNGRPDFSMWQNDSIQFDFEPYLRSTAAPTTQFGIALTEKQTAVWRYTVIPTEDMVADYRSGLNPPGVRAIVVRRGNLTFYEAAIPAAAICPTFSIGPGKATGFSLLVNDNDGNGRKGWLQWSSGIGTSRDSTLFGTMTFAE